MFYGRRYVGVFEILLVLVLGGIMFAFISWILFNIIKLGLVLLLG